MSPRLRLGKHPTSVRVTRKNDLPVSLSYTNSKTTKRHTTSLYVKVVVMRHVKIIAVAGHKPLRMSICKGLRDG